MFSRTHHVPAPGGADLRSLRLSLNSPVVARDDFPVGPAAAALAVFGSLGALRVVLALRAVRGGHVAFFTAEFDGPLDDPWSAVDAALSRAEAVGFLFDDELVRGDGDAAAARAAWTEFLAEPATSEASLPVAAASQASVLTKFRFNAGPPARIERREQAWVRLLARY